MFLSVEAGCAMIAPAGPARVGRGVMTGIDAPREETGAVGENWEAELEAFYAATYPRVIGMLTLLTGSRAEAEELAQDAFVQLIPRWDRISGYDDPTAWVFTTARRMATSRWRRARVAARALPQLAARQPQDARGPELSAEVADWLRGLSIPHREVLVLHHALGMSVEEIAAELGVAPGTVKSRLSRARDAARAADREQPDEDRRREVDR